MIKVAQFGLFMAIGLALVQSGFSPDGQASSHTKARTAGPEVYSTVLGGDSTPVISGMRVAEDDSGTAVDEGSMNGVPADERVEAPAPQKAFDSRLNSRSRGHVTKRQASKIVSAKAPVSSVTEDTSAIPDTPHREAAAFDPVPSDQVPLILKRFRLVEKLLIKHARAYDYRTLTVKELQAISEELDQQARAHKP